MKVVIFGIADFASLAHHYLKTDSDHEVVAFTVTSDYLPPEQRFEGRPVLPFETIERTYSPTDFALFAPMSHRSMNRLRQQTYDAAKAKGYSLISYISSRAMVLSNASVGDNCFILEGNVIQPYVTIGNNVVLWSGNHIGHHSVIHDHVLFTSHVVLSGHCVVEPYAFMGVNSTVRDGVRIAEGTFVGMAAAIQGDTDPWSVYHGSPARKSRVPSTALRF